jgi:hypothetical protein
MQEIQRQCFKMGIPLKTRHREVAPNQYEFAPLFGNVTTQIDQNLMVMQITEEVAVKHGLAALLLEKPFQVGLYPLYVPLPLRPLHYKLSPLHLNLFYFYEFDLPLYMFLHLPLLLSQSRSSVSLCLFMRKP